MHLKQQVNVTASDRSRPVGLIGWHLLVWRNGGLHERALLVMFVVTYVFLTAVAIWMISVLLSHPYLSGTFELFVTVGLALSNYGAFHDVFSVGVYNKTTWRELYGLGHFGPHKSLAADYQRLFETHGEGDGLLGAARWAFGCWAVYYGMIATAFLFAFAFLPVVGELTPVAFLAVDAPVVFVCRYLYKRHMPFLYVKSGKMAPPSRLE